MHKTPNAIRKNDFLLYSSLFLLSGTLIVLSIYFPLIILSSSILFFAFSFIYFKKYTYPFLVTTLVLCHYFIIQNDTEISYGEIAFFILMMFLSIDFIARNLIINKSPFLLFFEDKILILYFIYCSLLIPIAIFNNSEILMFFREMFPFAIIGLFFIYRHWSIKVINLKWILLGSLIFLSLIIAFKNLYGYKTGLAVANYYYEIIGIRKSANEPFLMTSISILIPLIFYTKNNFLKIMLGFLSIIFAAALVLTFSRGYWVGILLILGFIFIFESPRNKKYMFVSALIIVLFSLVFFKLLLPDIFDFLVSSIFDRFLSVGGATSKDMSFLNRIAEWKSLIKWIEVNPIVGYGFGSKFYFHDILKHEISNVYYSHNLYLYLIFKTGIVGLFIFMTFYFSVIIRGIKLICRLEGSMDKSIIIGLTSLLIVNLLVSISSPQLIQKDSNLVVAISVLFIQLTDLKFSKTTG